LNEHLSIPFFTPILVFFRPIDGSEASMRAGVEFEEE
jgi:hypothetical protein